MAITSKLIGARGRKQAEKLGIDPSRVPPGQYLTEKFPVLTVGSNPKFDLADWDLRVDGEVEAPLSLTWDQLHALPQAEVMSADRMGFWELNGCHNDADPWREQRHWF